MLGCWIGVRRTICCMPWPTIYPLCVAYELLFPPNYPYDCKGASCGFNGVNGKLTCFILRRECCGGPNVLLAEPPLLTWSNAYIGLDGFFTKDFWSSWSFFLFTKFATFASCVGDDW